jgi:hypothetical protein
MSGTGLRTYATGRVAAGRWEGGRLVAPLELWQCANAAEGAAEAALAARRWVDVCLWEAGRVSKRGLGRRRWGNCANYFMRQYSQHLLQECVCLLGKSTLSAFSCLVCKQPSCITCQKR